MSYKIIPSSEFKRQVKALAKKYKSLKSDLEKFQKDIIINPRQGDDLGGNVYKVRIAIASKSKGKSGGARIITYVLSPQNKIYLLTIFDKSEIENITKLIFSVL
jgi:mRNA-degrading endonuclease RelE of RelBE toxin-antitoxin system